IFFFQAEDGIRDYKVTGVQTCALPIYGRADVGLYALQIDVELRAEQPDERHPQNAQDDHNRSGDSAEGNQLAFGGRWAQLLVERSEERRVGKECRCRWWGYEVKEKK